MPISDHLNNLIGAQPVAKGDGTILDAIRAKYAERRAAEATPETTKLDEKDPAADAPQAETATEEPAAQATEEQPAEEAPAEGEKAKPVAFKAIATNNGVIIGIGGAAGDPSKVDLDDEFIEKADLVKMAFDFCSAEKRTLKANHREVIDGAKLVQSWVGAPIIEDGTGVRTLKADEKLTPAMTVVGIDTRDCSHWFVGVQLPEALKAKAAEVVGFSWGASVAKTEV